MRESMTNPPPSAEGAADRKERPLPEVDLGGADAVEKTTYVVGDGTEPEAGPSGRYVARDAARSGGSIALWAIVSVAALIALVYAIGIFH
jgi:hypothetical protein